MSSHLLDISHYVGDKSTLSDGALRRRGQRTTDLSNITTLHCSDSRLASLVCDPVGGQLATLAAHLTTLVASHNSLVDLSGLEAFSSLRVLDLSHNELRDLDALRVTPLHSLRQLETINLSYNSMRTLELTAAAPLLGGTATVRRSVSLPTDEPPALPTRFLDLSHNALHEVPELRCMQSLEELNLDFNMVRDLSALDGRLPLLSMRTLRLAYNRLASASSLVPLAGLAGSLRQVSVYGNPFTLDPEDRELAAQQADDTIVIFASPQNASPTNGRRGSRHNSVFMPAPPQKWWWRAFLLFLCPLLRATEGVPFSGSEQRAAGRLFRERDALSRGLLELMNAQRGEDLEVYLFKQTADVTSPPELPDRAMRRRSFAAAEMTPAAFVSPEEYRTTATATNSSSAMYGSHRAAAPTDTRPSTQASVNGLPREEDSQMRASSSAASRTLPLADVVRAMQGKLRHLSNAVDALARGQDEFTAQLESLQAQQPGAPAPSAAASAFTTPPEGAEGMKDVLLVMRQLQQVMGTAFADLGECRAMRERERRRAAVTIQRHYRGHRARREWRTVQRDFSAFKHTVDEDVTVIQKAGRAYAARRKLGAVRERRQMKAEISSLRREMEELRNLVQQHIAPANTVSTPTVPASAGAGAGAPAARSGSVNSPDAAAAQPTRARPVLHSRPGARSSSASAAAAQPPANNIDEL